ncbi:hypothetical protein BAU15_09745 [Enterococcus sp. JM4C]|uniref:polysaccharide deacetylase family protein n=1 Tax=Candidatus Enterococcus huntleyi TaxID=1857217 RepID=UPI00137ACC19|nr:polysaccharide deacetylase family protein [Enterococcus sp. JM4C]KAF1298120.1 hypothetical protein BAU15_09745 [Enterococcus sp. JM4C]
MFRTLVFHEVRPEKELATGPRPIRVADGYEDSLPMPLYVSVAHFQEQINFLKEQNYHCLTLSEVKEFYEKKKELPEKSVLITFDDCYQSMKEYAYPILKKAGMKATVFVVKGWLFTEEVAYQPEFSRCLSVAEVSAMADVFETANHTTHFHKRQGTTLSQPMWEPKGAVIEDLRECNEYVIHQDVFAYPFGLYNQETVAILDEMAFKLAFTTKTGWNTKETAPLELHREVIPEAMSLPIFQQLMEEK